MQITTLPIGLSRCKVINAIPTCSHRQDAAFLDRVQRKVQPQNWQVDYKT